MNAQKAGAQIARKKVDDENVRLVLSLAIFFEEILPRAISIVVALKFCDLGREYLSVFPEKVFLAKICISSLFQPSKPTVNS